MKNYKCLSTLLNDNNFDLQHIIDYYVSYISVFYCCDVEMNDELKDKVNDIQLYIQKHINRKDDMNVSSK